MEDIGAVIDRVVETVRVAAGRAVIDGAALASGSIDNSSEEKAAGNAETPPARVRAEAHKEVSILPDWLPTAACQGELVAAEIISPNRRQPSEQMPGASEVSMGSEETGDIFEEPGSDRYGWPDFLDRNLNAGDKPSAAARFDDCRKTSQFHRPPDAEDHDVELLPCAIWLIVRVPDRLDYLLAGSRPRVSTEDRSGDPAFLVGQASNLIAVADGAGEHIEDHDTITGKRVCFIINVVIGTVRLKLRVLLPSPELPT